MTDFIYINRKKSIYTIDENAIITNTRTGKTLDGWIGKRGYRVVTLRINPDELYPRFMKFQVHRLVAQTFISNPDNKPQVNHIDGNKLNNKLSNLEWVTNKENYDHARRTGLVKTCDDLQYATVDNTTVHKICKLLSEGKRNIEIIEELGLPDDPHGKGLITRIRTGRAWKDISGKYDFIKTGSLKKVPDEIIHLICQEIDKGYPVKRIFNDIGITNQIEYPRFKGLVFDIRTGRCHKKISQHYNFYQTNIHEFNDHPTE